MTPPEETGGNREYKHRPKPERPNSTRPERRIGSVLKSSLFGRRRLNRVVLSQTLSSQWVSECTAHGQQRLPRSSSFCVLLWHGNLFAACGHHSRCLLRMSRQRSSPKWLPRHPNRSDKNRRRSKLLLDSLITRTAITLQALSKQAAPAWTESWSGRGHSLNFRLFRCCETLRGQILVPRPRIGFGNSAIGRSPTSDFRGGVAVRLESHPLQTRLVNHCDRTKG